MLTYGLDVQKVIYKTKYLMFLLNSGFNMAQAKAQNVPRYNNFSAKVLNWVSYLTPGILSFYSR